METASFIINVLVLISILGLAFFRKYIERYAVKKGENLATKEDISEITEKMEEVKTKYAGESHMLVKKRETYEKIAQDLQVFIIGRDDYEERKKSMTNSYSIAWLWGSDDVIKTLNEHIKLQESIATGEDIEQEQRKKSYANCMLAMRKDAGYALTKIDEDDYKFFQFT